MVYREFEGWETPKEMFDIFSPLNEKTLNVLQQASE